MATQQYIADIQTKSEQLTDAITALNNGLDQAVQQEFSPAARNELKRLHGVAVQKRDNLDASVRILKQHLKSKPKLLKLVSDKYRNARQFIENGERQLGEVTQRLENLKIDIFRQ
jgi:hypothetical protein